MHDEKLKSLLQDLGRALNTAMTDAEVSDSLDHLRREGYAVFLMLDRGRSRRESRQEGRALPPTADAVPLSLLPADSPEPQRPARPARKVPEPEFRINANDLAFLQSVGIDPTRSIRRRRRRKRS